MVKSNSNPSLLKTIVCPRDMLRLKAMLPEKRYKNSKPNDAEKLPSVNVSRNENQRNLPKMPLGENKNIANVAPKQIPKDNINVQLKNNAANGRPSSKQ